MHREQLWFIVFCHSPGMSRLQILNLQCKSCGGWLHVATTSAQDSNRGISATRSLRGIVPSSLPKPRLAGTSHSVQISEQAEPRNFVSWGFRKSMVPEQRHILLMPEAHQLWASTQATYCQVCFWGWMEDLEANWLVSTCWFAFSFLVIWEPWFSMYTCPECALCTWGLHDFNRFQKSNVQHPEIPRVLHHLPLWSL